MIVLPAAMEPRQTYLDSHPSLNASMSDYEARDFSPTIPDLPSQHSGFRSNNSEYSEASSRRSHSPPSWRKAGSGWFSHQQTLQPIQTGHGSKETSPQYQSSDEVDDMDVTACRTARKIPLPESPVKYRSPSNSPEPSTAGAGATADKGGGGLSDDVRLGKDETKHDPESPNMQTPTQSNYIRFSSSLEVVQRTEPVEAMVGYLRKGLHHITQSKYNLFLYALSSLVLYWALQNLLSNSHFGPVPDLIKVAGLAKSFEPVIYYSEQGHAQIEQLQETGVAVWDLGESVRSSNMTSAPIIVKQLDDLSDSLKTLAHEMMQFFAAVDGDVDNILLVMEWAQRELTILSSEPPSTIGSAWSNAHSMLKRAGLLTDSKLAQDILGQTYQQRTKATLDRTFYEFLNVLEDSINNELSWSTQLFQLFTAIDNQFLNLQRTVIREQDQQERMENDFLESLWTKVIGVNASKLRKYEKNKDLLRSVRDRTVQNKHILVDHQNRLLQLKANLEFLRRKLVSPLVRSSNSSTLSIEDQIKGLEGTYQQLKGSRESQKRKMMEIVYGAGSRRISLPGEAGGGGRAVEGSGAQS